MPCELQVKVRLLCLCDEMCNVGFRPHLAAFLTLVQQYNMIYCHSHTRFTPSPPALDLQSWKMNRNYSQKQEQT